MMRGLRVPERVFAITMWVVSLVFAGFLIGLGGKIVGDLPGVDKTVDLYSFVDAAQRTATKATQDSLLRATYEQNTARATVEQQRSAASAAYASQREAFDNWIATRKATVDPKQDPEVIGRTRTLDTLKAAERRAQTAVEQIDATILALSQASEANQRTRRALEAGAQGAYRDARNATELRVFLVRLALTLPLLLIAGWLIARKRKSDYWPLARGFVLFAAFTFFVELVPYLPSYGGYVRYSVGIIASFIAGLYVIRAMRKYLAQREQVEQQSDEQRRASMPYEDAVRRIQAGICPGCERPISGAAGSPSNFCVHCGMRLFDDRARCQTHKNAFYPYCPTCGVASRETGVGSMKTGGVGR